MTGNVVNPAAATPQGDLRPDLAAIARWIAPGAHVLDLGCGDGELMSYLQREKRCQGYGVEIADAAVLAALGRGVSVIQQNIESGLGMFGDSQFDVVVLSMAIQATHDTERVLREMSEVGAEGIVSLPNFGHWTHAWSLLRGRMPVSRELPFQWYDTPNLHMATLKDFEALLARLGMAIVDCCFMADGREVSPLPVLGAMPNLRATQGIYRFRRR